MMNVDLICVGKLNAAYCAAGVAEYQKRLGGMCKFRIVELPEETIHEKNASQTVIDRALEKEGAAILAQVKKGAALVALIEHQSAAAVLALGPGAPINVSVGRITSTVVSGVGFLGAGTILREGPTVKGLTTAAGLWVCPLLPCSASVPVHGTSASI